MIALLTSFLSASWMKIVKYGAIAAAILGAFLYIRNSGRIAEKAENYEISIKAAKKRREIERDVATRTPDEHREWLRKHGYLRD